MRIETFFDKFELLAEAPGAVGKIRELVLELAVSGRLVPQDVYEESGERLLKQIDTERLAAVKARRISPVKPMSPIGTDDLPFTLPLGWACATLIELILELQTGPFGSTLHKSDYQIGGVPVINPASLKDGKIVPIDDMAVSRVTCERLSVFKLCEGDIVMARRGEMGRCAIVTSREAGWLCGTGSLVLRMPRSTYAPYLALLIGSPMSRAYLGGASVGSTMQNLNQSILAKMPVGVPPLAEQQRIVAKVDELMALCDRLEGLEREREERRGGLVRVAVGRFGGEATVGNLGLMFHSKFDVTPADIRKSILALAVQGKLVPQDPDDEPANECLARLGLQSTADSMNDIGGDENVIPSTWTRVRFENVALVAGGVTLGRKYGDVATVSLPYLRVANVKRGEIDLSVVKEVSIAEHEIDRYALREHDLLMTEGGDWDKVGRAAIWRGQIPQCLHQNHVFRARMRSTELAPEWFELYFNSPIGRSYFESASKQTTNLASINMRQVRGCPVPLPPLAEQRRIVGKVDELMGVVDALEAGMGAARESAGRLWEAVVAEMTAV